jgi:hypothetical protein
VVEALVAAGADVGLTTYVSVHKGDREETIRGLVDELMLDYINVYICSSVYMRHIPCLDGSYVPSYLLPVYIGWSHTPPLGGNEWPPSRGGSFDCRGGRYRDQERCKDTHGGRDGSMGGSVVGLY